MAGYTSNCGCSTTQTFIQTNQANYITVNGKQVLKQFISPDNGKMLYAHIDSTGIDGVVYKAQKPNENSLSNSNNSLPQTTQRQDAFSSGTQNPTLTNSNQGQYRSSHTHFGNSTQLGQTKSLGFHKAAGSKDAYLTLAPGQSITLDQENGAGKLVVQNLTNRAESGRTFRTQHEAAQSRHNIVIKQSPNRYGGYDYSVIDDTHKYGQKSSEEKLHLPDKSPSYNRDGNNVRTYKIGMSSNGFLFFPYDDSKQISRDAKGQIKPRQTIADMQPNQDIDLNPGDSVNYLRPKGLDGSSATVMIGDDKYEISNKDKSQFAYVIHKKQEDGSTKPFYATDSDIKNHQPLDENFLRYNYDLELKFVEKIPQKINESLDENKTQENPFEPESNLVDKLNQNQPEEITAKEEKEDNWLDELLQKLESKPENASSNDVPNSDQETKASSLDDLFKPPAKTPDDDPLAELFKDSGSSNQETKASSLDDLFKPPAKTPDDDPLAELFKDSGSSDKETKADPLDELFENSGSASKSKNLPSGIIDSTLAIPRNSNDFLNGIFQFQINDNDQKSEKSFDPNKFRISPEAQNNSLFEPSFDLKFDWKKIDLGNELKGKQEEPRLIYPLK